MSAPLVPVLANFSIWVIIYFFVFIFSSRIVTGNITSTFTSLFRCPTYRILLLLLTDFCDPEVSQGFLWTRTPVEGDNMKQCSLINSNWTGDTLFILFYGFY